MNNSMNNYSVIQQVQASRTTIAALREIERKKLIADQDVLILQKALDDSGTREQKLKSKCDELSSKLKQYESEIEKRTRLTAENVELRSQIKLLKDQNEQLLKKHAGEEVIMKAPKIEPNTDEIPSESVDDADP